MKSSNFSAVERNEEDGSAVAEFILMALPLLLPATLFFIAMNQSATVMMNTTLMARQAVAAFTTGDDDRHGHSRVNALIAEYKKLDPKISAIDYQVSCQQYPCISPGAAVEITLRVHFETSAMLDSGKLLSKGQPRSYINTQRAVGFVDKWR